MALAGELASVCTERWAREAMSIVSLASVEKLVRFRFLNVLFDYLALDRPVTRNPTFFKFNSLSFGSFLC